MQGALFLSYANLDILTKVHGQVLLVDPEKNRICLTAKKALIDSALPIISSIDDAQAGVLAHAVVYKVLEKVLLIEFYNGVRGVVPMREAT